MTHEYQISGMTCTGCQAKVQGLLSKVEGVKKVTIDLGRGIAVIEMDKHVSTGKLKAALESYPTYQIKEAVAPPPVISESETGPDKTWFETYKPILVIFGYIAVISGIAGFAGDGLDLTRALRTFMAGFFLSFSFFKMLDLDGFADSYSMYDIVAKKFRWWGYLYAFVELGLGLAYAVNFEPGIINYVTFLVMSVSIIGVLQSVFNRRKIKCACLGVVFNLPMSTVTIVEDSLMMAMSVAMIVMSL